MCSACPVELGFRGCRMASVGPCAHPWGGLAGAGLRGACFECVCTVRSVNGWPQAKPSREGRRDPSEPCAAGDGSSLTEA